MEVVHEGKEKREKRGRYYLTSQQTLEELSETALSKGAAENALEKMAEEIKPWVDKRGWRKGTRAHRGKFLVSVPLK